MRMIFSEVAHFRVGETSVGDRCKDGYKGQSEFSFVRALPACLPAFLPLHDHDLSGEAFFVNFRPKLVAIVTGGNSCFCSGMRATLNISW